MNIHDFTEKKLKHFLRYITQIKLIIIDSNAMGFIMMVSNYLSNTHRYTVNEFFSIILNRCQNEPFKFYY